MNELVKELLDSANVVVSGLMDQYHDSREVPDNLVRLCAAIASMEERIVSMKVTLDTCIHCLFKKTSGPKNIIIAGCELQSSKHTGWEETCPVHEDMRHLVNKDKEDMTCFKCDYNNICKWAYDLYNTDGDCIASK